MKLKHENWGYSFDSNEESYELRKGSKGWNLYKKSFTGTFRYDSSWDTLKQLKESFTEE